MFSKTIAEDSNEMLVRVYFNIEAEGSKKLVAAISEWGPCNPQQRFIVQHGPMCNHDEISRSVVILKEHGPAGWPIQELHRTH